MPTYLYVNVALHELGHAIWGFEDVGHAGCTNCLMDYDGVSNQSSAFTSDQILTIQFSIWGPLGN